MGKIRSFFGQPSDKERAYDRLSKGLAECFHWVFPGGPVTAGSGDAALLSAAKIVCSEAISGTELRLRLHEILKEPHELMTDELLLRRVRDLSTARLSAARHHRAQEDVVTASSGPALSGLAPDDKGGANSPEKVRQLGKSIF